MEAALLGVGAIGFACVVLTCWLRWRQIRATAQRGEMLPLNLPIPAITCPTAMEPGVFGVFRPVLLLPAKLLDELTTSQLEAVIAHELCHVKRRDNLAALLQMAVESIWWFNPLVWWVGRRMRHERERAADEHVLRVTGNAQAYAEGILKVCRLCLESPVACVSGISGSDLRKQIDEILRGHEPRELRLANRVFLSALGVCTFAVPIAIGIANSPPARAQARADAVPVPEVASVKPAFEAALVKPNRSGDQRYFFRMGGATVTFTNYTLKNVIMNAYQIRAFQLLGGPSWINTDRFDIEGKVAGNPRIDQRRLMVQALLKDRFNLVLHRDTRELPIFQMTVAKNGFKLQPLKEGTCLARDLNDDPAPAPGKTESDYCDYLRFGRGTFEASSATLAELATSLSILLDRTVVDRTGIAGTFRVHLSFAPDQTASTQLQSRPSDPGNAGTPEVDGLTIFTAIQEQLGLKLD
jgi:bla regulator protein blaR1